MGNIFDLWAEEYDKDVELTDENNKYPFAGYKEVINFIYNSIKNGSGYKILDIGFGTGKLTEKLYNDGYNITGIDFSKEMIKIANSKMPKARLIEYDFSKDLPEEILNEKFDFIISTYAIHHLKDNEKVNFLEKLYNLLDTDGKILVGDVAFLNRNKLEQCKLASEEFWDDEEYYIVYEELKNNIKLNNIKFYEKSFCSGVVTVEK